MYQQQTLVEKHHKLPNCHYMANCVYLDDSYITQVDFKNYQFANFVVARFKKNNQIH